MTTFYLPIQYFNDSELTLYNEHFLECPEDLPPKMIKKILSRQLKYENLKKSQGEEAVELRMYYLKNKRSRSRSSSTSSISSTSSNSLNENVDLKSKSRLYDSSISYSDIVRGI